MEVKQLRAASSDGQIACTKARRPHLLPIAGLSAPERATPKNSFC